MALFKNNIRKDWTPIEFDNNGKKYKFVLRENDKGEKSAFIGGGYHPNILESQLQNVEIVEEKSIIFKKHFIVIYTNHYASGGTEIRETRIAVMKNELKNAEIVVSHLNDILQQREEQEKLWKEKQEKIKQEKQKYIDFLRSMDKSKVICLDVETTGLNPDEDEILQLSIIDGNNNILFNEYIKPNKRKRWPKAQEIHGISYQMVKDKPTIDEHLPLLNQIINDAEVIVGYNIESFDLNFIRESGISVPHSKNTFDVMLKFAPIFGKWDNYHESYKWQKLETCAKYYGYKKSGSFHNSLEDVRATLYCYFAMLESNLQPK